MKQSGINYLLRFSKIQLNQRIGGVEAVDFKVLGDGTQMGHLIAICECKKSLKRFDVPASVLNWKISKFLKGSVDRLDYASITGDQNGSSDVQNL